MTVDDDPPTNTPKRVLFLITDLDPGGAERALVELVTRLDRTRWAPTVVCLQGEGELMEPLRKAGIPVKGLGATSFRDSPRAVRHVRRQLNQFQPELVCTYLYHANMIGRLAAATVRPRPRVFSGIRVAEKRSRTRFWMDRATDFLVTRHFCVSQDVATFSHETGGLPISKLHVLPNGVDVTRFDAAPPCDWSEFGFPPGARVLLYVGRLDEQKGVQDLLTATIPLLTQLPDLRLVLAGEGPLRGELEQRIDMERLDDQIRLPGRRQDVPSLMRGATLLVHASHWEGAPNVVLEAMAARLPIVCTAAEGTGELLRDGQFGKRVPIGDMDAFRRAVQELLESPTEREKLAEAAYEHVSKEFTWEATVANWEAVVLAEQ
ncbi:MAG: glycosyltransferase [Planctomyces sp.]|nr:glycosyltransferase [Planctomyces sp.]